MCRLIKFFGGFIHPLSTQMLHENPRLSDVDEHDEFESVSIDESCIMTSREISVFFYSDTKRRVVTAAHSFCCIFCVGILCILWLIVC